MIPRPALAAAILTACGITLVEYVSIPVTVTLSTVMVLLILQVRAIRARLPEWARRYGLAALVVAAGALHFQGFEAFTCDSDIAVEYPGPTRVRLFGRMASDVYLNRRGHEFVVEVEAVADSGHLVPRSGRALVRMRNPAGAAGFGDIVKLSGELTLPTGERNPGEFNYRAHLARRRISHVFYMGTRDSLEVLHPASGLAKIRRSIYDLRHWAARTLTRLYPENAALLLRGLLLADRGMIAPETKEAFIQSGVIHVLAVSGLHVGLITAILLRVLGLLRFPLTPRRWITVLLLLGYVLLTDARPPVVRAATFATLLLWGRMGERPVDIYNLLGAAALVILAFSPNDLFQSGFHLSFCAVLAIATLEPKIRTLIRVRLGIQRLRLPPWLVGVERLFYVSTAAFIGTLPLTIFYFNRLPPLAILMNLWVVPLIGLILGLGIASLVVCSIPFLGAALVAINSLAIDLLFTGIGLSRTVPVPELRIYTAGPPELLIMFSGIAVVFFWKKKRVRMAALAVGLVLTNVIVWKSVLTDRPDRLRVTVLDVGQGDAIHLALPHHQHLLVDAGVGGGQWDSGRRTILPYLKRQRIDTLDYLVITHPHNDHVGGAPYLLRHFPVRRVIDARTAVNTNIWREYESIVDSLGIPRLRARAGMRLEDLPGVGAFILHPGLFNDADSLRYGHNLNEYSVVLKIQYRDEAILLTGDAERKAERYLSELDDLLLADFLKTGHHGSNTSSMLGFLEDVQPEVAAVSVGAKNIYRLPSSTALERLRKAGAEVLRTDREGAIVYETDGDGWRRVRYW